MGRVSPDEKALVKAFLVITAAALALTVAAAASAETLLPPRGKVFHGGTGYTGGHIDSRANGARTSRARELRRHTRSRRYSVG